MSLISPQFAAFVCVVLGVYYALPAGGQISWLLFASYAFYFTWSWKFPLLLFGMTLLNFSLAFGVRRDGKPRRTLLWIGIGLNVATLALFKFINFFPPALLPARYTPIAVALPIGLSFYVLQAISYLVDVSRGQLAAETDLSAFALYMAYFPKLLAGPIERARTFLPRLATTRSLDDAGLTRSLTLIVVGLVRKVVIADPLGAMIPPQVFETPAKYTGLIGWLLAYIFFLYNDFAGYTDLARGVSGLFGIELSPNFARPFFARSFAEVWTRWHMTLSFWLRDYIYYPLSRTLLRRNIHQTNIPNLIVPPMVTMLVCGLWHGTGPQMLVWGGLHGVYLVIERAATLGRPVVPIQERPWWQQGLRMAGVFSLFLLAAIPFRMEVPIAVEFLQRLLEPSGWVWPDPRVIALIVPAVWLDWMQERHQDEIVFARWPLVRRAALLAVVLFALLLVSQGDTRTPFVYESF